MARTSLTAARAELYALLQTGGVPFSSDIAAVYDHEPRQGDALRPTAVTVSTAGMTPTAYLIALRIYVAVDVDARLAQNTLDTLIQAVDARMTAGFGPSLYEVEYNPDLRALVATNILSVGREDPVFR